MHICHSINIHSEFLLRRYVEMEWPHHLEVYDNFFSSYWTVFSNDCCCTFSSAEHKVLFLYILASICLLWYRSPQPWLAWNLLCRPVWSCLCLPGTGIKAVGHISNLPAFNIGRYFYVCSVGDQIHNPLSTRYAFYHWFKFQTPLLWIVFILVGV